MEKCSRLFLKLLDFRLDKEPGLTVHFNVHMDPSKFDVQPEDIIDVLSQEILNNTTESVLGDLVVDLDSLDIQGSTIVCLKIKLARVF